MSDQQDIEYKGNPRLKTRAGAKFFIKQYTKAKQHYTCYQGHLDCSIRLRGPCLQEILNTFPLEKR